MKTYKAKNGKSYTKKQICEAIEYWKSQLNESKDDFQQSLLAHLHRIGDEIEFMVNQYDSCTDEEAKIIDKVLAWDDTMKGIELNLSYAYRAIGAYKIDYK